MIGIFSYSGERLHLPLFWQQIGVSALATELICLQWHGMATMPVISFWHRLGLVFEPD